MRSAQHAVQIKPLLNTIVWAGFVVIMSLTITSFALAQDITESGASEDSEKSQATIQAELKEKRAGYQDLQDEITLYKENLKTKQQEKTTLSNQLEILDQDISITETEIESTEQEIDILELEVDDLQIEIEETQQEIDSAKNTISDLILDLYNYQQLSTLEIALTNSTLSEYSHQVEYTETVSNQFKENLDDLQTYKKDLKEQKREVTEKKDEQEEKQKDLEVQKSGLAGEIDYKANLLIEVGEDEEKFQDLIADIQAEQSSINTEITQLEKSARTTLNELSKNTTTEVPSTTPGGESSVINLPTSFDPGWPLNGRITAGFKDSDYPFRNYFEHGAIDIAAPQNTSIRAADSGVVSLVRFDGTSNYAYVAIVHADNFQTVYGHVSAVYVQPEQVVEKGQIIALSGATPGTVGAGRFTTGPHLHFEVWLSGVKVDPRIYLP